MMMTEFAKVDFHDGTLHRLSIDWQSRTCEAEISLCVPGGRRVTVVWSDVQNVSVPHAAPWGKSVSINVVRTPSDGVCEIEMQSGDTIVIEGTNPEIK